MTFQYFSIFFLILNEIKLIISMIFLEKLLSHEINFILSPTFLTAISTSFISDMIYIMITQN